MKEIPLGGRVGGIALVDDEDYARLNVYKWCVAGNGYVMRGKTVALPHSYLHRAILDAPKGVQVDHKDGNPLNNQRSNLRLCTSSQNSSHSMTVRNRKSKYRGVTLHQGKYRARATIGIKQIFIGYYDTEEDAARAYDAVVQKQVGEFAILNFPENDNK